MAKTKTKTSLRGTWRAKWYCYTWQFVFTSGWGTGYRETKRVKIFPTLAQAQAWLKAEKASCEHPRSRSAGDWGLYQGGHFRKVRVCS